MKTKSRKSYKKKITRKNSVPEIRSFYPNDLPTKFANLWFRLVINLFTVLALGIHFTSIDSGYFTTITIFALPLFYEYARFRPMEISRRRLRRAELSILGFILFLCFLGFMGILNIICVKRTPYIIIQQSFAFGGGLEFPTLILYILTWLSFFISVIDIFAAPTKAEKDLRNAVDKQQTIAGR
jgi:hypothetical protein